MKRTLAERDRFIALKIEILNEIADDIDKIGGHYTDRYWLPVLVEHLRDRARNLADIE